MADAAANRLAIRADRAFDGRVILPGGALVLCADGKIIGVEPPTAPVPEGWPVAENPGATLLPGLIDCHVHLCADSRTGALDRLQGYSGEQLGLVIEAALRAQLAAGVTTVRDLGDRRWPSWTGGTASPPERRASPARPSSPPGRRSPRRAVTAGIWAAKPAGPASFAPRSANTPSGAWTSSRSWPAAGP